MGNGITKTTVVHKNIVLEEYIKDLKTVRFALTYHVQKEHKRFHYYNLFDFPKYKMFLSIAEKITGLSKTEINVKVNEVIILAEKNPAQLVLETSETIEGEWVLTWKVAQELLEPGIIDDNVLRYFSLLGIKEK